MTRPLEFMKLNILFLAFLVVGVIIENIILKEKYTNVISLITTISFFLYTTYHFEERQKIEERDKDIMFIPFIYMLLLYFVSGYIKSKYF